MNASTLELKSVAETIQLGASRKNSMLRGLMHGQLAEFCGRLFEDPYFVA